MSQNFDSRPEVLSLSLMREFLHEGRIVVYTLSDIHQSTLDLWTEHVRRDFEAWQENLYLIAHDFTPVNGITLSPYLHRKTEELTAMSANKPGRSAIISNAPAFLVQILQILLINLRRQQHPIRQRNIFNNRADAVKWLEEMVEAHPA